ncbi:hypothetical protein [Amycolatopsis minnesotensis]|uniref:hypothetical protein n=1 Tax=Amycolatopsis minnesotensis TaxID=337894 RepID=UPI0031CF9A6B
MSGMSPLDTDKVKRFNAGAHDLKREAESGGFAINEDGLNLYKKACEKFINEWSEVRSRLWGLGDKAPLGDFPYADAVADFNVKAAIDGSDALIPNIDLMVDGYKQALEALEIAHRNYARKDEENNLCFARINQQILDGTA